MFIKVLLVKTMNKAKAITLLKKVLIKSQLTLKCNKRYLLQGITGFLHQFYLFMHQKTNQNLSTVISWH